MHEWTVIHSPDCSVTRERKELLEDIWREFQDGNWKELAYLHGAFVEYDRGGDQEAEDCTCGVSDDLYGRRAGLAANEIAIKLPFNLMPDELVLDPGAEDSSATEELVHLAKFNYTHDEIARVLLATVCLLNAKVGTVGECLHTASIWERG